MPTVTAPYVETTRVVTGFLYQLSIAENAEGRGITRLDIGPYYFAGATGRISYPEAVTNEMCPSGWQAVRWFTDDGGASWLRWDGGRLDPEDGEALFQVTSNYPPTNGDAAALHVWRVGAKSPERYPTVTPDYSVEPPAINPRHDVIGRGQTFLRGTGCLPPLVLTVAVILWHVFA